MSYDYNEINQITTIIDENLPRILKEFDVNLHEGSQAYYGRCPIHGSNNNSSFCYYHNKNKTYNRARWRCFTNHCHITHKDTSIGFVRGLLSNRELNWANVGDRSYGFYDTIKWVKKYFKIQSLDEGKSIGAIKEEGVKFEIPKPKITLTGAEFYDMIGKSSYFKERGFSEEILDFYQVGQPLKPVPKFYFREFVPIYDCWGQHVIGATCRSIFEKCPECSSWHDPRFLCPDINWRGAYCKWKNWEFNRAYSLYNLWHSREHIQQSGKLILVESPGNIWKLWEAGFKNCIATYGTELAWAQIELLKRCGAEHLYLLYDNDEAGEEAFRKTGQKLWQDFYIHKIQIPTQFNDIGEISNVDKIKEVISGQL